MNKTEQSCQAYALSKIKWSEVSEPAIDSNVIANFKAQKGSKDIIKIVHVTTVVQL